MPSMAPVFQTAMYSTDSSINFTETKKFGEAPSTRKTELGA